MDENNSNFNFTTILQGRQSRMIRRIAQSIDANSVPLTYWRSSNFVSAVFHGIHGGQHSDPERNKLKCISLKMQRFFKLILNRPQRQYFQLKLYETFRDIQAMQFIYEFR